LSCIRCKFLILQFGAPLNTGLQSTILDRIRLQADGALGDNGQHSGYVVGVNGEIGQCAVSVWLTVYAVMRDDVGDRAAVDREQLMSKQQPLWDAHVEILSAY